mgnify:CR=1 FL=1
MCIYFSSSFFTDYQLVVDARIQVTYKPSTPNTAAEKNEILFPERHGLTLPINGLNCIFENVEVTFNHSTKLDTNRYTIKYVARERARRSNNVLIFFVFLEIIVLTLMALGWCLLLSKILTPANRILNVAQLPVRARAHATHFGRLMTTNNTSVVFLRLSTAIVRWFGQYAA